MWIKQTERKLSMTLEAGTKVEVLKEWDDELAVCLLNGEKVFIKKNNLDEKPPVPCEKESIAVAQDVKKSSGSIQQVDKRKRQGKGVHKLRSGGDTGGALF